MAPMVADSPLAGHRLNSENPDVSDLKKIEIPESRRLVGQILMRARKVLGWSQKELAAALEAATGEKRDPAQLARWESGAERWQFDVLIQVEPLRQQLVIAMASGMPEFEVVTELRLRRPA